MTRILLRSLQSFSQHNRVTQGVFGIRGGLLPKVHGLPAMLLLCLGKRSDEIEVMF